MATADQLAAIQAAVQGRTYQYPTGSSTLSPQQQALLNQGNSVTPGTYTPPSGAGSTSTPGNSLGQEFNTIANVGNADARYYGNQLASLGGLEGQNIVSNGAQGLNTAVNTRLSAPVSNIASYLSNTGTSAYATPAAPTLPGSGITPATDWQTVQNQVQQAIGGQANVNNAQQLSADQQALNANMAARGMTGSNVAQSGQVGLQNLASILGAQANAQGLQAGITAGQTQMNQQNTQYQQALNTIMQQYGLSAEAAQQMLQSYTSALGSLGSIGQTGYNEAQLTPAGNLIAQGGNLVAGQQAQEATSSPLGEIGSILSGIGSIVP